MLLAIDEDRSLLRPLAFNSIPIDHFQSRQSIIPLAITGSCRIHRPVHVCPAAHNSVHSKLIVTLCHKKLNTVSIRQEERFRWSRSSVLAFSTLVRGFKPGRNRRIFKGGKKSSARLPSEGK